MTEFHVEVVRIGQVEKHPNADSLSMTKIHGGYPVLFRSENFKEGDLAVYVPVDSVVPATPEWAWLSPEGNAVPREKDRRVRAKKLRGVFSMGLLNPAPEGTVEGQDVAELLGITKYEEPEYSPGSASKGVSQYHGISQPDGREAPAPKGLAFMPDYYDIEGFRKYASVFDPGEEVVVTEKIHGQNARFVVTEDGELHVGSRSRWLNPDPKSNSWAHVAEKYGLKEKLTNYPGFVLFGETYGNNADMTYGVNRKENGDEFVAFDLWDSNKGEFLGFNAFTSICRSLGIPTAPVLDRFCFDSTRVTPEQLLKMAEGQTTMPGEHVREGFVIKPVNERWNARLGRVIAKLHGEGFLLRK